MAIRLKSRNKNKNPEQGILKRQDQKSTVSDLVYKYLRKIAYTDSVRKQRNNACNKFRRRNARRRIIHPSRKCSNGNGIRSYISKALSMAVHSGYLIPTDRTGRFLQLSPEFKLCHEQQKYRYEPYNCKEYSFGNTDISESSNTPDTTIGRTPSPLTPSSLSATFSLPGSLLQPPFISSMPPLMQSISVPPAFSNSNTGGSMVSRHFLGTSSITNVHRRPRSEKKPIPDDQKDEKYYERRKRNNQAAKKSRDARKIREDHIALRATMLEHENAILKAQVMTLREEAQCLRHMLIKQQTPSLQSIDRSISSITPVTLSPPHSAATLDCQI